MKHVQSMLKLEREKNTNTQTAQAHIERYERMNIYDVRIHSYTFTWTHGNRFQHMFIVSIFLVLNTAATLLNRYFDTQATHTRMRARKKVVCRVREREWAFEMK